MAMNKTVRLHAPLTLTERVKTPFGPVRIVLGNYPTGLMSVELVVDKSNEKKGLVQGTPIATLSANPAEPVKLGHGEFIAKTWDEKVAKTLLKSGLFEETGRVAPGGDVWRLAGLALIEFTSAFAPPIAASKASFPSHLFGRKAFDAAAKRSMITEFGKKGYTKHSPAGNSVWVVREYCEANRIDFVIYLVKRGESVVGIRVCTVSKAAHVVTHEAAEGHTMEIVYESPVQLAQWPVSQLQRH